MKLELRPISSVIPYENNPRLNDASVDAVVESIKEFGFQAPIIVDAKGVIIAGHTRLLAAQKLGLPEVPVIIADQLTDVQVAAYRIMDNRSAEKSKWDLSKLAKEFEMINVPDFNLDSVGFSLYDMERITMDFMPKPPLRADVTTIEPQPIIERPQNYTPSNGLPENPYELEDDHAPQEIKEPIVKDTSGITEPPPNPPKQVSQFTIIFNNDKEFQRWTEYVQSLKVKYPNAVTVAERLIMDIDAKS